MNHRPISRIAFIVFAWVLAAVPPSALACAACYGKTDSPLAQGMNAGIFLLLGVVTCVLGGIAAFFIYLIKRSSIHPGPVVSGEIAQPTKSLST